MLAETRERGRLYVYIARLRADRSGSSSLLDRRMRPGSCSLVERSDEQYEGKMSLSPSSSISFCCGLSVLAAVSSRSREMQIKDV